MDPVGGFGVAYFAIVIFFPLLIAIVLTFRCLPKKTREALLERIDNIE
jgi:hypothetical protein